MLFLRILRDMRAAYRDTQRRFNAKVLRRGPDECWPWLGPRCCTGRCKRKNGLRREPYGQLYARGRTALAHRWALFGIAAFTRKDKALHTCDTPLCCNPRHLYAGTEADNLRDALARNRITRNENGDFAKVRPRIGDVMHSDIDTRGALTGEHIMYWAGGPVAIANDLEGDRV